MNPPQPHTAWLYITLTCWPPNPRCSCGHKCLVGVGVATGRAVGTGPNAETAVWKKYSWEEEEKTIYSSAGELLTQGNPWRSPTPTLQPMASSVCRTTMIATVVTATTLVSSWTTGQKVSTNTEPEIRMAITISVQCNHSNGMIQKTCRGRDYKWHLC